MKKVRKNTKELILEAGLNLFSLNGYDNTSVKEIARKANTSHGLLYNYFDSKEDLLKQIFINGLESIKNSFKEFYTPKESLVRLILTIFDVFDSNEEFWRLRNSLKMQKHLAKIYSKEINSINDFIIGHIAAKLKTKDLEDYRIEAIYIFTVIDGISQNYLWDKNYPIETMIKMLLLKCR